MLRTPPSPTFLLSPSDFLTLNLNATTIPQPHNQTEEKNSRNFLCDVPTLPLILDLTVSVGRWDSGLGWEEGGTACNRSACIASDAHWPLSSMYVNLSWPDTDTDPFQMAPPGLSLGGSGQYQCCGSLVTKALRDPITEIL